MTQLLYTGGKSFGVGGEEKYLCHRCKYLRASKVRVTRGSRGMPPGKSLRSGPLGLHFQHSGAKIRASEQSTNIFKFGFFGGNFQRKVGGEFR